MKKTIAAEVSRLYECKAADFVHRLQELIKVAEKSGFTDLRVEIDTEQEPWSECAYAKVALVGSRLETDEEYKARMEEEERIKTYRRNAYEALKKEFGDA